MREWLNRAVSKTVEPLRVPWVRIPPSPPAFLQILTANLRIWLIRYSARTRTWLYTYAKCVHNRAICRKLRILDALLPKTRQGNPCGNARATQEGMLCLRITGTPDDRGAKRLRQELSLGEEGRSRIFQDHRWRAYSLPVA